LYAALKGPLAKNPHYAQNPLMSEMAWLRQLCGLGSSRDETIVFAARSFGETMHTLTGSLLGVPLFLWAGVALAVVVVLLDPWRKAILLRVPDWCISGYCIVSGLAFNWAWAYSWFSQRFALTSAPVLRMMASFVALNALIGLLATLLHDQGKWRLGVAYFALASGWLSWFFHG
jgi:hypothetical protein